LHDYPDPRAERTAKRFNWAHGSDFRRAALKMKNVEAKSQLRAKNWWVFGGSLWILSTSSGPTPLHVTKFCYLVGEFFSAAF
jgi:hypothetical protein